MKEAQPFIFQLGEVELKGRCINARWCPSTVRSAVALETFAVPASLVLEALVQCAGRLLHELVQEPAPPRSGEPRPRWLLAGVRSARFRRAVRWEHELSLLCLLEGCHGRFSIIRGEVRVGDESLCTAEFVMSML